MDHTPTQPVPLQPARPADEREFCPVCNELDPAQFFRTVDGKLEGCQSCGAVVLRNGYWSPAIDGTPVDPPVNLQVLREFASTLSPAGVPPSLVRWRLAVKVVSEAGELARTFGGSLEAWRLALREALEKKSIAARMAEVGDKGEVAK
jgi:hypothetical protein